MTQPDGKPDGEPVREPVREPDGEPVGRGAKFGVVGAALAVVGAILLVISLTALQWIDLGGFGSGNFANLHDALTAVPTSVVSGLADAYFSWLAWLLAVVTVLMSIAANLPSPASGPLRALGAVTAAGAITVSFFAIKFSTVGAYSSYLSHARIGFYFVVGGFLLAGIGALIGPKNRS